MKHIYKACGAAALSFTLFAANSPAWADTQADLEVTATVEPACQITTAPVAFGSVDPSSSNPMQTTGTVSVTCTAKTEWTTYASQGAHSLDDPDGLGWIRSMESAGFHSGENAYLKYKLYIDPDRVIEFTPYTGFSDVGTGSAQEKIVYGEIVPGQTATPADSYSDVVIINLEFGGAPVGQ